MKTKLCLIKISLLLYCFVSYKTLLAQSKSLLNIGGSVAVGINDNFFSSSDSVFKHFINSNKNNLTFHSSIGFNIWIKYVIKRKLDLQTGIGYRQLGFVRNQENLSFNQTTYPGIGTGKIEDLSNTKKSLYYNYNFNYLNIPVMLNWNTFSSFDYKYRIGFTAGLDIGILLNHSLHAKTNSGFYIDGENSFKLDSSGFSANVLMSSALIGFRFDYDINKKTELFVQPLLFVTPLSLTKNNFSAIPYGTVINFGITYAIKE